MTASGTTLRTSTRPPARAASETGGAGWSGDAAAIAGAPQSAAHHDEKPCTDPSHSSTSFLRLG